MYAIRNRSLRYAKRVRSFWFDLTDRSKVVVVTLVGSVLFWTVLKVLLLSVGSMVVQTEPNSARQSLSTASVQMQSSERKPQLDPTQSPNTLGMIYNASDQTKKDAGYASHAFNTLISERIGLLRPIPDTRNELCRTGANESEESLAHLTTSVIICFFNEDFHTLQRTIYTVLEKTSDAFLQEIILIDDHSDNHIGANLSEWLRRLKTDPPLTTNHIGLHQDYLRKVHYYRTPDRAGLIRARLYGTHFAQGQVLFFLDSHCEVNQQWLEPLLARIAANRTTVVCPIIDLIDPDTFALAPSPLVKGGFNWGLHFKWDSVPSEQLERKEDFIKPIRSPTMAGGLFAIDRQYFNELGGYDPGMDIWGGENIEISFRIWMCGGSLEIVPCSRVGHVFRHRRPYGSPEGLDTLAYNSLRVAHVWMDDYLKYYLASRSDLATMAYGDVQERVDLRRRLNCSTFEWYLNTIYPEARTPDQERQRQTLETGAKKVGLFGHKLAKVVDKFALQLADTGLCLETELEVTYKGVRLLLRNCSRGNRRQLWTETVVGDIRRGPKSCLEVAPGGKQVVRIGKCHEMGSTQQWQHQSRNNTQLYNVGSGTCLSVKTGYPLDQLIARSKQKDFDTNVALSSSFCSNQSEPPKSEQYTFTRWNLISF